VGAHGAGGAAGPPGALGAAGVDGVDGTDGTDGIDGTNGLDASRSLSSIRVPQPTLEAFASTDQSPVYSREIDIQVGADTSITGDTITINTTGIYQVGYSMRLVDDPQPTPVLITLGIFLNGAPVEGTDRSGDEAEDDLTGTFYLQLLAGDQISLQGHAPSFTFVGATPSLWVQRVA
jgi:hypothetical protein